MRGSSVTNPKFAFELLRASKILVSYMGVMQPRPIEVHAYGERVGELADEPDVRCLWYTEGARLSLEEMESISQRVRMQWRSAIVSGSPEMRFVASAFSLGNRHLRYFTPEQLPLALRHLNCTREEQDQVLLLLSELRQVVERSIEVEARAQLARARRPSPRSLRR